MRVFVPTTNRDTIRELFRRVRLDCAIYAIYSCDHYQITNGYLVTDEQPTQFVNSLDYFIL